MPIISPVNYSDYILIYGGSFSPPTIAHAGIIKAALGFRGFDQIWVMPCRNRKDKTPTANESDRLQMVKLMLRECFPNDPVYASNFEYTLPEPSRTYLTHLALTGAFPNYQFTYMIGEDSLETMPYWHNNQELMTELNWLLIPRTTDGTPKAKLSNQQPLHLNHLDTKPSTISSTLVRAELEQTGFSDKLASSVLDYIVKKELYKCKK